MNCLMLMLQSFGRITATPLRASRSVCVSNHVRVGENSASRAVHRHRTNSSALPSDDTAICSTLGADTFLLLRRNRPVERIVFTSVTGG